MTAGYCSCGVSAFVLDSCCCGVGLQAQNLIKAGYKVVVWNRSSDKCEPLKAAGAEVGSTVVAP